MTTPKPDALSRLESLHAAATPGEWKVGISIGGQCLIPEHRGNHPGGERCKYEPVLYEFDDPHLIGSPGAMKAVAGNYGCEEGGIYQEADSAAIVALHNAFPALARVVRAAREFERVSKIRDEFPPPPAAGVEWSYLRAREALDAALAEFEKEVGRG